MLNLTLLSTTEAVPKPTSTMVQPVAACTHKHEAQHCHYVSLWQAQEAHALEQAPDGRRTFKDRPAQGRTTQWEGCMRCAACTRDLLAVRTVRRQSSEKAAFLL